MEVESEIVKNTTDVLIHIDENLDDKARNELVAELKKRNGVVSVSNHKKTAHLLLVMYDREKTNSGELLASVTSKGIHAELVGL